MKEDNKVHVLHLLPSLSKRGGTANVVLNYHRVVDSEKVVFDYIYMADLPDNFKTEIESLGGRCWHVPFSASIGSDNAINAFFSSHAGEFDVLHCHIIFGPQLYAHAAKKAGITHVILHSHATQFSDKRFSAIRNGILAKFVGLFATDYLACSEAAKVLLGRHADDASVVRNAVDCGKYSFSMDSRQAVRDELSIDDETFVIGTVGRLVPQKNQQFLIEICRTLRDMGIHFKCLIAGSGDLENALKDRIKKYGLQEQVLMLGMRSDSDRIYSALDLFILTSIYEGLPVSAIEAQSAGLPCVLSDVITEETAFGNVQFISLDEGPQSWAKAITSISPACVDERAQGVSRASDSGFDISREAESLVAYYRHLMGK